MYSIFKKIYEECRDDGLVGKKGKNYLYKNHLHYGEMMYNILMNNIIMEVKWSDI